MGVHDSWGLHMASPCSFGVTPGQGTRILHWLSLLGAAQQGQQRGTGWGCPSSTLMLAGAQRNPGVKVDPGFVAGSPAWPCVRRRLSFHYSGGATNCLDERGWVYVV